MYLVLYLSLLLFYPLAEEVKDACASPSLPAVGTQRTGDRKGCSVRKYHIILCSGRLVRYINQKGKDAGLFFKHISIQFLWIS